MAALITRVRLLINDPAGGSQIFADQDIQDVMDEARMDAQFMRLQSVPTLTLDYLDYYAELGNWEDGATLASWGGAVLTPSTSELIAGHWKFAASTTPPVYLTGKSYDIYRAAADLLERLAARWVLSYNITANGQNLQRSQPVDALQKLARTYRAQSRPTTIALTRSDLATASDQFKLGPIPIDYGG
jgi:hypothetical protein